MCLGSECLRLSCLLVLNDVKALVARDSVVKRGGSNWHLERSVRSNLWLLPSGLLSPVANKHVVSVALSEVMILHLWLYLFDSSFRDLNLVGLEEQRSKSNFNLP